MKNKILHSFSILSLFLLMSSCSSEPDGIYSMGPSSKNCSFISFSPPNEYHSDYITWTGNKYNGVTNCNTRGSYTYNNNSKTISVSGFYNSNCGGIGDRNGSWKFDGNAIVSPNGVRFTK
jgi:hypothetical protein